MRVSTIGMTLGLAAAALVVGCGPTARMAILPNGASGVGLMASADPFAEIRKVADNIWNAMETDGFESRSQGVTSQGPGGPKYAFMNTAVDTQDESTRLYRAGTYSLNSSKPNVLVSFVASTKTNRSNPAAVAAATRAIKTYIQNDWGHPVTEMFISEQQKGPKFAFIAFSKNQPDDDGTLIDWTLPGHYAVSSGKVEVYFGSGHSVGKPNSANYFYMDKKSAKK
jgi:hypothetical protein